MPQLNYSGQVYSGEPGESVLDTLTRHGVEVSASCRAGVCQSCVLRAAAGAVPEVAQRGLKPTLVEQGFFLACVCRPEGDLAIEDAGGLDMDAEIVDLHRLSPTVMRVRLRPRVPFAYRAGQYITLRRADGLSRSYSLASLPEEERLELHVRRTPGGRMSGWLFESARAGEPVQLRGPAGGCFYTAGAPEQPLLLAGTGTGLAPLLGICRDALRQGHWGPIRLYHGALALAGLYLRQELAALAAAHDNLTYSPVVREGGAGESVATGAIDQVIAADLPRLNGWRAYLCGDPAIVGLLQRRLFLAGAASREIFADPFLEAAPA